MVCGLLCWLRVLLYSVCVFPLIHEGDQPCQPVQTDARPCVCPMGSEAGMSSSSLPHFAHCSLLTPTSWMCSLFSMTHLQERLYKFTHATHFHSFPVLPPSMAHWTALPLVLFVECQVAAQLQSTIYSTTSHNPTQRCTNIRNNIYQSLINFHAQKKPCESVSPCRHPDSRQLFSSQTQTAEMKGRAVLTAWMHERHRLWSPISLTSTSPHCMIS